MASDCCQCAESGSVACRISKPDMAIDLCTSMIPGCYGPPSVGLGSAPLPYWQSKSAES